jgi:hypothetical protein
MNDYDKANLEFILNASKETLAEWFKTLSKDDMAYAEELVQAANLKLMMRLVEVHDNVSDFSVANTLLDKYKLNK